MPLSTPLPRSLPPPGVNQCGHPGRLPHGPYYPLPRPPPPFPQVFVNVGILVAFLMGLPYDDCDSRAPQPVVVSLFGLDLDWWQVMFGLAVVPALLQVSQGGRGGQNSSNRK